MLWVYNIAIQFYWLTVKIFSLFNSKASLFVKGRVRIFDHINEIIDSDHKHIWFHFASLGEFEQGRPVLENLKHTYPGKRIVITFFSPSGYEIRKNYTGADGIFYLPLDTPENAIKLIKAFNPELAIFTKYEYWYHYFQTLADNKVPILIISAIFRKEQIFFKWYGGLNRKILKFVSHFFVQNEESKTLLRQINIPNVTVSGDTRFDRVAENASSPKPITAIAEFCYNHKVFIGGSTWPADEQLIANFAELNPDWKFIIAPHEIDHAHIASIQHLFPGAIRYSEKSSERKAQILIIDNIGLLSSIYQYGNLAYIGGGFGVGIHNTLEAAAFGIPVIFGPNYRKFQEAKDLIEIGAAKSISNLHELTLAFEELTQHANAADLAKQYVNNSKGSTEQIINYIGNTIK